MEDHFDISGVCYCWNSNTRVLRNNFAQGARVTRSVGIRVVDIIEEWIDDSRPYALLCNGSGVEAIDTGYREEFKKLFEEFPNVVLAVYQFPAPVADIPILFGLATNINLKAFDAEDEAESWVRSYGFKV